MPRLIDFDVLSFDCYGTLIDWETGIRTALAPWRRRENIQVSDEAFVEAFGKFEWEEEEENPTMLYPEILGRVLKRMAASWGVYATPDDMKAFGRSVGNWPAFQDTPLALAYLKQHFKLVILSNVDRESFSYTNAKLGVEFDHVYTAQDVGSHKPDMENFQYLLSNLEDEGFLSSRLLHMAESLYHDHIPAKKLGLSTCWIHRRHGKPGHGATRAPDEKVQPDFRFTSLQEFAMAHQAMSRAA
jgi:2-haloalkanoic acid dehalogenase type II